VKRVKSKEGEEVKRRREVKNRVTRVKSSDEIRVRGVNREKKRRGRAVRSEGIWQRAGI
jgi:hypothetical protein